MSHVKVLMRRPRPVSSVPSFNPTPIIGSLGGLGNRLKEVVGSAFATRKSADDGPLSFVSRVREFIARNGPDIDLSFVINALAGLKTPVMVTLGVAAVAGLVYLAWKLYKHFTTGGAANAVDTIMADLKSLAPDLFEVPGMEDSVEDKVANAVESGPEEMVKQVAEIRADVMANQHKTNPARVGSGIDYFRAHGRKRGTGMVAC